MIEHVESSSGTIHLAHWDPNTQQWRPVCGAVLGKCWERSDPVTCRRCEVWHASRPSFARRHMAAPSRRGTTVTEPDRVTVTNDEFLRLGREAEAIQVRYLAELKDETQRAYERTSDLFNRWEDEIADLHPGMGIEISDMKLNAEGMPSLVVSLRYPTLAALPPTPEASDDTR